MKRSYLLFIALFLTTLCPAQEKQLWSKGAIEEDIAYLAQKIVEVHPDPFFSLDQASFDSLLAEVKSQLPEKGWSTQKLAKALMPVIAALEDGHTELKVPINDYREFRDSGGALFPYPVKIFENKIMVQEGPYREYLITNINGIPVSLLLQNIRSYISAETESFRNAVMEKHFKKYLWFEVGALEKITLEKKGEIIDIDAQNLEKDNSSSGLAVQPYYYTKEKNADWLTINDMTNKKRFKRMLKTFIPQSDSKTLIIDLRNNGGGNSAIGEELIRYLHKGKYKQVDHLVIKSSKTQKRYFYKTYIPFYLYPILPFARLNPVIRATLGKNGKLHSVKLKSKKAGKKAADYKNVFVLTSHYTFSSAAILANALQYYDMATVVGEETGGVKTFFGDNVEVSLPHTGLTCTISFKKFVLPGASDKPEGVKPDLPVLNISDKSREDILSILNQS